MRHSIRAFIALLSILGTSVLSYQPSSAQSASKVPRIGFFSPGDADATLVSGFQTGLKELGYSEGRNILIDYRWGQGRFETLPQLASELLNSQVDVIVAVVTAASLAAKAATDNSADSHGRRGRSGRCWIGRITRSSRREYHWDVVASGRHGWQALRTHQRD